MQSLLPLGASCALLAALSGPRAAASQIDGSAAEDAPTATSFRFDSTGVRATSTTAGGLDVEVSPRGVALAPAGGGWALSLYAYDVSALGEATESAAGAPRRAVDGIEVPRDGFTERVRVAGDTAYLAWTIEPTADARGLAANSLWLGLRARGLEVTVDGDGKSATLSDLDGVPRLALHGVEARDAAGTVLEARLVDGRDGLGVRIDAANALYPITLAPTLAPAQRPSADAAAQDASEEDLVLLVADGGAPRVRRWTSVEPGGTVTLRVAGPSGRHEGEVGVLLFDVPSDGDAVLAHGRLAVDPRAAAGRLETFVVSRAGTQWTLPVPTVPGSAGSSIVVQGFVGVGGGAAGTPVASNSVAWRYRQTEVYVSSSSGSAGAAGTRTAPVATIEEAVALATSLWTPAAGYPGILIEGGTYTEDLEIEVPVSMRGGLDGTTWTPDPANPTIFVADHAGTLFDGIDAPATIQDIEFRSQDAPYSGVVGTSNLSRSVLVMDSTTALSFEGCTFASGRGARGVHGSTPGSIPPPASNGQRGDNATVTPYVDRDGGPGGVGSPAGMARETMWGGPGGDGAVMQGNDGLYPFWWDLQFPFLNFQFCATPGSAGGFVGTVATKTGEPGGRGADGGPGSGGTTRYYGGRRLASGAWVSGVGTDGSTGEAGCGGAGGGGGTGLFWSTPFPPFYYEWNGGAGGGGGAGGRGGGPGTAGSNGGASFAADLRDSSPIFTGCTFAPGQGGEGGDGGEGWIGGVGGIGGAGGDNFTGSFGALGASITLGLGGGGNGGFGGLGGHGGGGAGGHGGPSSGVYMAGTSAPPSLLSNNTFVPGSGGGAGSGGFAAADGSNGPDQPIWQ
ncbi:MAG: hypothetical protein AAGB93_01290 [Planctomycetota bacterium]